MGRERRLALSRRVDRIVHRGARPAGRLDTETDLDRFHRGDRHEKTGQSSVELPIPGHMAAEPDDHAPRDNLDFPTQRIAGLLGARRSGE